MNYTSFLTFLMGLAACRNVSGFTCTPDDREICNNNGYCNDSGDDCVCYDFLHYWPSEQCSTYHDGRELPDPSYWCYPGENDYYCSWLGTCASDGMSCDCVEQPHRYSWDRCLTWMHLPSGQPTQFPSIRPSSEPFSVPTTSPTALPSKTPTHVPTTSPTTRPTREGETNAPSLSPTGSPTTFPSSPGDTNSPTVIPTAMPTSAPTQPGDTNAPSCSPTVVPTTSPSPLPTSAPTMKPTMEGDTNSPTAFPTVSPTSFPTQIGDTNSPTAVPSALPSMIPSTAPTRSPTATPTLSPTPVPTQPGDTNAPSLTPTLAPSLSGVPRILSANVPLNQVSKTSFVVSTEVGVSARFIGGVVYCGVATATSSSVGSIPATIASTEAIKQQAHSTTLPLPGAQSASGSLFVDVLIDGLSPLAVYDVFCFAEDSVGGHGPLDTGLVATPVTTACCHEISFLGTPPRYILSDMAKYFDIPEKEREDMYAVRFVLSALPSATLSVSLRVVGNSSLVTTVPASISFSPQSVEMGGSFLVSSSAGVSFSAFLQFSGESLSEFRSNQASIALFVVDDATEPVAPPQLSAAYFDESGSVLFVRFGSSTDFATGVLADSAGSMWLCGSVLLFDGADSAGCRWESSSQVKVVFNYYSSSVLYPVVGGSVSVIPGVIKAHCAFDSCDAYEFTNATAPVVITMDPEAVIVEAVPVLVLASGGSVLGCRNMSLDASQSRGSGGRPWSKLSWLVALANPEDSNAASDASVAGVLSFLSSLGSSDLQQPVVIPRALLVETEYFISLGLQNFMQAASEPLKYATTKVSVLPNADISLSLAPVGPGELTVERTAKHNVALATRASVSSCSANMSAAARADVSLSYVWEVYDASDALLSGSAFSSTSNDPSSFSVGSMSFDVGASYMIHVTVAAAFPAGSGFAPLSSSLVFPVHIAVGGLVAGKISGASVKVVRAGAAFSLDTREAVDLSRRVDEPANSLQTEWSCRVVSALQYGSNCFEAWGLQGSPVLQASVLEIPAGKVFGGFDYEISVRVSSHAYDVYRSDTSSIRIESDSNVIQAFDGGYDPIELQSAVSAGSKLNADSKVVVMSTISCSDLVAPVSAVWSLTSMRSSEVLAIENMTVAAVRREFSIAQVNKAAGIAFPIGFARNVLTPGVSYSLRLSLSSAGVGNTATRTSFAEMVLTCNTAPHGGVLAVSPSTGQSFVTVFTLTASHWSDDAEDYPLRYHFKYQSLAAYRSDLPTQKASTLSPLQYTETSLPAGREVDSSMLTGIVDVVDVWDGTATATVPVEVLSMFGSSRRRLGALSSADEALIVEELLPASISNLASSLALYDVGSYQKDMQKTLNYFSVLGRVDCSLSPDCAGLHRGSCSSEPHTCGECLDGYTGVYGHSNTLCVNSKSDALVAVGSSCSSDEVCPFGTCEAGQCVVPTKTCALGRTSGEACSGIGQGLCVFVDYQGESLAEETCTVDNPYCQAVCSCEGGFVGSDCSIAASDDVRDARDQLRRDVCSSLHSFSSLLDASSTNLETLSDYVADILFMEEVVSAETVDECGLVLGAVSDLLSTPSLLSGSPGSTAARIVDILSSLAESDLSSRLETVIYDVLNNFGQSWQYDLLQGEEEVGIASDNLRISYSYPILSELSNKVLSAPQTGPEQHYGSDPFSMTLSDGSALLNCSGFEGYAMFATVQWGYSPSPTIRSEASLRTAQFRVVPIATADHNATVAATQESEDVRYSLELHFYEPISMDGTNVRCYELDLDTGSFDVCKACNVSSYSATSVTMSCAEPRDVLCPALSRSAASPFSRRLGSVSRRGEAEWLRSSAARSLQSVSQLQQGKYYTGVAEAIVGDDDGVVDTLSGGSSQQVQSATGMISFVCVLFGLVLFGFVALRQWDERDRKAFVAERRCLVEKGHFRFDVSAAFDESGKGLMERKGSEKSLDEDSSSSRKYGHGDGESESSLDDSEVSSRDDETSDSYSRQQFYGGLSCGSSEARSTKKKSPRDSGSTLQVSRLGEQRTILSGHSDSCDGLDCSSDSSASSRSSNSNSSGSMNSEERCVLPLIAGKGRKFKDTKKPSSLTAFSRSLSSNKRSTAMESPIKKLNKSRVVSRQKSLEEQSLSSLGSLGSHSTSRTPLTSEPFFEVDFLSEQDCQSAAHSETIFAIEESVFEEEEDASTGFSDGMDEEDEGEEDACSEESSACPRYPRDGAELLQYCIQEEHPEMSKGASQFQQYPPTSLLSDHPLATRIWRAFSRHHRVVRIFTYPSLRRTRVIRFAVAVNDLLWMTFACAVVYALFFPPDSSCTGMVTQSACTSAEYTFVYDSMSCQWDSAAGCAVDSSSLSATTVMAIMIICVVTTIIPRRLMQVMLEKVCAKRPRVEDCGLNSEEVLGELPEPWESVAVNSGKNIYDLASSGRSKAGLVGAEHIKSDQRADDWIKSPNAAAFDSGNLFQYNSWPALTKSYQMGYCDSISPVEEHDLLRSASMDLFQKTLLTMPLPWQEKLAVVNIAHLKDALDCYSVCDGDDDQSLSNRSNGGSAMTVEGAVLREKARRFGWMVAIMQHLKVHADGTPEPITWWQTFRHGSAYNNLYDRIETARAKSQYIQFQATSPTQFAPGQTDYKDLILVQNFVVEQLPSICKFAIKKELFELDHASPGSSPLLAWAACWFLLVASWTLMTAFILNWAVVGGDSPMSSIAAVLSVIYVFEMVVNECCQIFLLHVFVTDRLRPQLRDIYSILCAAYHLKLRKGYVPVNHVRVVQHLSASCRAARLRSLSYLSSAGVLSVLEDRDFLRCRHRRDLIEIGFVAKAVLFLPSLLDWAYEVVQTGVLDILVPLLWCGFILLQIQLSKTSVALNVLFWVGVVVAVVLYAKAGKRRRQQVLDKETMQLRLESAGKSGWNTVLAGHMGEADAGVHTAPEITGAVTMYRYCVFHAKKILGVNMFRSATVDENWQLLNRLEFVSCDGVMRSPLAGRGLLEASFGEQHRLYGELPKEIMDMMVVNSRAWHENQRWRLVSWLKSLPVDVLSHCWSLLSLQQSTTMPREGSSSDRTRRFGEPVYLSASDKARNLELMHMEEIEASDTVGMLLGAGDNHYDEDDLEDDGDTDSVDSFGYEEGHDVRAGPTTSPRRGASHALDVAADDITCRSDISGAIIRDVVDYDSRMPLQKLSIPNEFARMRYGSDSVGGGSSCSGSRSSSSSNMSDSRIKAKSERSRRSSQSSRASSGLREDEEMSKSSSFYDHDVSGRGSGPSESKSGETSSSVWTPVPQYGLIHAEFLARSQTAGDGNHLLPMGSVVAFATHVLNTPAMLNSSGRGSDGDRDGDGDKGVFVCSPTEVAEAVEPLVTFVSSSEQEHKAIEFGIFSSWLDSSIGEIMERRLSDSGEGSGAGGEGYMVPPGAIGKESLEERCEPPRMQSSSVERAPSGRTAAPRRHAEASKGDPGMLGMELAFKEEEDEVSVLTNPVSFGSPLKASSKSRRSKTHRERPSRSSGASSSSSSSGSSSSSSGSSSSRSSGSSSSGSSSSGSSSSGSSSSGSSSSGSSSRSSGSSSSRSSGSSISNPPVVSKSDRVSTERDRKGFEIGRVGAHLDVLEEASHEDSEQSSVRPGTKPTVAKNLVQAGCQATHPEKKVVCLSDRGSVGRAVSWGETGVSSSGRDHDHSSDSLGGITQSYDYDRPLGGGGGGSGSEGVGRRRCVRQASSLSSEGSVESHMRNDVDIGDVGMAIRESDLFSSLAEEGIDDMSLIDFSSDHCQSPRSSFSKKDVYTTTNNPTFYL